ncbi:MAG: ABC transporter ATP-binding protein [Acidobacteria bacterium]|nr:ABC transporter ATP-binding protein [Acidobacteriota bacterium]
MTSTAATVEQAVSQKNQSTREGCISFQGVEKRFGSFLVLRTISIEFANNETVVLLGANGSGKTTLLKLAAQLMRPSRGRVTVFGEESTSPAMRRRIGFVGHNTLLYDDLTAVENLQFFAELYGCADLSGRVQELLDEAGLASRSIGLVRTFSRGMRQRLTVARALLHKPDLLLLDEPATGLDRQGVTWLTQVLTRLHADGCTILLSAHGQRELLALASRAVVLADATIAEDTGPAASAAAIDRCALRAAEAHA